MHPILAAAIPLADGATHDWVHLLPAGDIATADGRGPYQLADAATVIAASMVHAPLAMDENHATDLAAPNGGPSPARGWIVEMQARGDGIWGRVEWTPSGAALLSERAYRGVSPVFATDKAGKVARIMRAALTNTPNLPALATLHHQDKTMDIAALRAAFGLPDTADEATILAHARSVTQAATETRVALQAQQTETSRIAAETVALQARLNELTTTQARERATAFVDGAIRSGKPVPRTLRDHYITRHMADAAAVELEFSGFPNLGTPGIDPARTPDRPGDLVLSAEDKKIIALSGVSEEAFRKGRAAETTAYGAVA